MLYEDRGSAFRKYADFFVDDRGLTAVVKFELAAVFLSSLPGALGFALRKWTYPSLFRKVGSDVLWGKNISLLHPRKITIGSRVAIDDGCVLDARGAGEKGIEIGNDVIIARATIIQGKASWLKIEDRCVVGSQCQLTAIGGIHIGKAVQIGGQCYIGGGRHGTDHRDVPMADQGIYSEGPVVIEDDVWLGAGVIVLDGVRIAKGSVIGAGTVVREDVPPYTTVSPHQRLVMLPRGQA